jgi:hypothetical protein
MDKLSIGNEMAQLDAKNRGFYDDLSDEEKKRYSPFIIVRWASAVEGSADMQAYYLISANEKLNKHFFDISSTQHKKLHWLLASTVSPGMGTVRHNWIPPKKKESNNRAAKFFRTLYPHLKEDEIDLLGRLNDKAGVKDLARQHGWTDERIKKEL